jgi:hypothetical protein
MKLARSCFVSLFLCVVAMTAMSGVAQAQAAADSAAAPMSPTTADLKAALDNAPPATAMQAGDPSGAITGTIKDVPVADSKKGLTVADLGYLAGQNKIAINFVWTLLWLPRDVHAGWLRHGRVRPLPGQNANHTYMMNFSCTAAGSWRTGSSASLSDGRHGRQHEPGRPGPDRRAHNLAVR